LEAHPSCGAWDRSNSKRDYFLVQGRVGVTAPFLMLKKGGDDDMNVRNGLLTSRRIGGALKECYKGERDKY